MRNDRSNASLSVNFKKYFINLELIEVVTLSTVQVDNGRP
jgi:hypothetical protein